MKRIATATAKNNRFVDGNKSTGRKATQFSAEWCNQVQEELATLLEANGVTLGASEHQISDLFAGLLAGRWQILNIQGGTFDYSTFTGNLLVNYASSSTSQPLKFTLPESEGTGLLVVAPRGFEFGGSLDFWVNETKYTIPTGHMAIVTQGWTQGSGYRRVMYLIPHSTATAIFNAVSAGTITATGAVVGKSLEATAGGVLATGDISTSNGNLSGKNVNATGNIETTNGNVSASGDVTAKNGKAVLSGNNQRPAGLWMNDGASSNKKEASVAMDANGQLHISGSGGVEIGGIVKFSGIMTLDYGFPDNKKSVILASANLDISVNDYKDSYPSGTTLRIVNYNSTQINVTYRSNTTRAIGGHSFADFFIVEISGSKLWFVQG